MTATKATVRKYPAYKDSGVEWLGEIPEEWERKKLKHLCKVYNGDSLNEAMKEKFTSANTNYLPYISSKDIDVNDASVNYENGLRIPTTNTNYKVAKKNSVLLCIEGGSAGKKIAFTNQNVCFVNKLACFVGNPNKINNRYLFYSLKAIPFKNQFDLSMTGLIGGVAISIIKNIFISTPPIEEQTAIAAFLDDKTEKIDRAIAQKEKMIALLKERKQIIIQNAVTKGLNPNAKMKDSGVEWIGEIPEGWAVKKLFGICRFVRGNSAFSKDELLSYGEYVAIQYGKSYQVTEVNENFSFYVNSEFYKDSQVVNHGDTVLISTSETIEDLGHSVFYNRSDLGLLGGEQMLLKPNIEVINCKYLFYSSRVFSKELRKYATGIKVSRFNINDLKTIYAPIPPIHEQNAIVAHIEAQSAKIYKAIALQEQEIEKLKQLKSTLIDSAVTGKIRVS